MLVAFIILFIYLYYTISVKSWSGNNYWQ